MQHIDTAALGNSLRRFGRFALSSLAASGVDLAGFVLLCDLLAQQLAEGTAILLATCLARVLSSLTNYLVNYFLVFHSRASYGRSAGLYAIITIAKTLCSGALVAAAADLWPALPSLWVKIPADTLLFFVNYLLQKLLVY